MTNERDRVLDKIKKLLSMADDKGSPKEAMIAANRARKLMDKHQIEKGEIIDDTFIEQGDGYQSKRYPSWRRYLNNAVAKLNDCRSIINSSREGKLFTFQGFKSDVVLSCYMIDYLTNAAKDAAKGRTDKNAFLVGFSLGVLEQVDAAVKERSSIKTSSCTGLVVKKTEMVSDHFGQMESAKFSSPVIRDREDLMAGMKEGRESSLHGGLE